MPVEECLHTFCLGGSWFAWSWGFGDLVRAIGDGGLGGLGYLEDLGAEEDSVAAVMEDIVNVNGRQDFFDCTERDAGDGWDIAWGVLFGSLLDWV